MINGMMLVGNTQKAPPYDTDYFGIQFGHRRISEGSSYKDIFGYKTYPYDPSEHIGLVEDDTLSIASIILTLIKPGDVNNNIEIEFNETPRYSKVEFWSYETHYHVDCAYIQTVTVNGDKVYKYRSHLDDNFARFLSQVATSGTMYGFKMILHY